VDWETSFYLSLNEVQGIVLAGGGDSTLIAGMVALGHRLAVVALPGFGGKALDVWKVLTPGRDLPAVEERAEMAIPWSNGQAERCARMLTAQLASPGQRGDLSAVPPLTNLSGNAGVDLKCPNAESSSTGPIASGAVIDCTGC